MSESLKLQQLITAFALTLSHCITGDNEPPCKVSNEGVTTEANGLMSFRITHRQ